ncbi:unnamed protein product [Lactuca saligna]|uniref:Ubiquitin-like protease family profile domain-containing protein n=1 Tax=Lactuca saligna TaxID=75948 RepID=A0AA35ZSA7_LACSI|nr:unnamed protein product [Lactuca saligna]
MSMPLSVVPFKNEEKGFNRRGGRPRMKSDYLKSPDIIRVVDITKGIPRPEKHVAEWIFSLQGEPTDIVFRTLDGFFPQRISFKSLLQDGVDGNLSESERKAKFLENLLLSIEDMDSTLRYVGLKIYILDYLKSQNHPKTEMFSHVMPHRLEMPWRTINNHIDCGVFTMRRMETYMGGSMNEFKVGFKKESPAQDDQLAKLRTKYLYKIITREYNVHKDYVLQMVDEFHKIPARQRSELLSIAKEQIHTRLDDFS